MYLVNLVGHSFVRWLVLALGFAVVLRSGSALWRGAPFTRADTRLASAFVAAADTQLLLGLGLWFITSPLPDVAFRTGVLHDPSLFFFALAHPSLMTLSLALLHVGRVKLRRTEGDRARHRTWLRYVASAMLLVACAVPWPRIWAFGRPLWRSFE
ncbi:MAG: hypothetical protein RL385_1194 [Pseudomonadota bacterium]